MTYCDTFNNLMTDMDGYIEYAMNEIKDAVEECLNLPPSIEKKNYNFVNGNKIEERYLDEEDWENGWSHV